VWLTDSLIKGTGFKVDSTGQLTVGSTQILRDSAGMYLKATGFQGTSYTVAAAGINYKVGSILRDPYNGVWQVATLAGSGIATLTMLSAPTLLAGPTPANPVALTAKRGSGASINITWNDSGAIGFQATHNFQFLDALGNVVAYIDIDLGDFQSSLPISVLGSVDASTGFLTGGVQTVGFRRPGWTAATGTATRTTFNTATVTLPQLAERVKALIDDLLAHGLIGA
jgi:hypothetical protein